MNTVKKIVGYMVAFLLFITVAIPSEIQAQVKKPAAKPAARPWSGQFPGRPAPAAPSHAGRRNPEAAASAPLCQHRSCEVFGFPPGHGAERTRYAQQ